jgi:hydroxymethylglutaryl-CoA synthase
MKPRSEVGIVGYGAYVPRFRLDAAEIDRVWRGESTPRGRLFKAVAGPDEDTVTIAIEAARNAVAMAGIDPADLGAVWVGTESKPYAVKPSATIVADAIGALPRANAADWEFACKPGTEAMQASLAFVASGMARYALCAGCDTAQGRPADALEYTCGAGGAAYVIGAADDAVAVLEASVSHVTNTPDFFRREGRPYPSHGHRFTGEPAYFAHTQEATRALLAEVGRRPQDYRFAVFHQPNVAFPQRVGKALGFSREQVEPYILAAQIGNTYAGSALLGMAAALDEARPGDRLLLCSYGSGAGSDAFSYVVTERILERRGRAPALRDYLARRREIDYAVYARYRNKIRLG